MSCLGKLDPMSDAHGLIEESSLAHQDALDGSIKGDWIRVMPRPQKYRDVIRVLKENGWVMLRDGKGSHELWGRPDESVKESIPRHGEVSAGIVGQLMKKLTKVPPGWR
jgi:predicted RNA binding protein YcfA (HicA-like mRNA interferase family)